ncbi:MAG: VOC family protein [Myxococcota bacterium]
MSVLPRIVRHDLRTNDAARAKNFYRSLFDWKLLDVKVGAAEITRIVGADERVLGAIVQNRPGETTTSFWAPYFGPVDVEQAAKKAPQVGGQVAVPLAEVPIGRLVGVTDPTGAFSFLLSPKDPLPPAVDREGAKPGWFCWDDLLTNEVTQARDFYEKLLGLGALERGARGQGRYVVLMDRGTALAGITKAPSGRPAWLPYVEVADLDAAREKAQKLGAKITVEPTSVLGAGRFLVLVDPTGAALALHVG